MSSIPQGPRAVNNTPSTSPPFVTNTGQETRRLQNATQFAGRTTTTAYGANIQPVADPNSVLTGYATSFSDAGRILFGTIMDGTALAHCYRVHPDHGTCPLVASAASHTSSACLGATAINTYAPGTRVVIAVHDKDSKAVILGAVANYLDVGKRAVHDYISPASRKRVDDCHKKYIKQPKGGQIVDYSAGRPYDSTLASEWGAITTTGAAITLDDFMLRASVNEFCGIYGFYHDSLLRVAGYNLQLWTAGHEREAFMDQAEYNDVQGYTPYPWEHMGILTPGQDVVQQYEPENYQCFSEQPFYARWENKHEFAQPYHRTQDFFGYMGQGHRRVVHAPPPGVQRWTYKGEVGSKGETPFDSVPQTEGVEFNCSSGPDKLTNHEDKPVIGLSEQNTGLDGRIFFASAKGVTLLKRILLPVPYRIKRPEDIKNGDDATTNYKAASMFGSGPDHDITGDIKTTDDKYPNLQRASAVMDLHGYLFNYAGLHPFYWHAKDYKTWEQQDLEPARVNQKIPDFSRLSGSMYLSEESPKQFNIDHRYKTQKFYETECYVSLLEDGGVVIGDGYGAEIRMSAGCVFISAPGDVWLKGGRDVQTWAGNDAIIKANKSIDISSTEKNIRIKAEQNLMLFGGNDSEENTRGGVLIESRSSVKEYDFEKCGDSVLFGGIVMRAPKSNIIGVGNNIYLRTGGGEIEKGTITLDAAKGEADIVTKSRNLFQFVNRDGRIYHFFGMTDYQKANMFSEELSLLAGRLGTERDIIAGGGLLCQGSVLVSKGHIVTEQASRGAIFVAPCDGECQDKINEGIDKIRQLIDDDIPQVAGKIDQQMLSQLWYGDKKPGNDRVLTIMEFSFRTDDDYNIEDFMLYEDRWQQLARIGNREPQKWKERSVKSQVCDATYPFPGKKWLVDEKAYKQQDFKIATYENGGIIDKRRNEAPGLADEYKNPEFKEPAEPKAIDDNYFIIPRG
jgi:hypothetical protein